jgi:sirohydrochlorin ferrochelatase
VTPVLDNLGGIITAHASRSLLLKAIGDGTFQTQQHLAQLKSWLCLHLPYASPTHKTVGSPLLLAELQAAEADRTRQAEVCSAA